MVFGFFELFIILSVLIKLIISGLFGFLLFELVVVVILFVLRGGEDLVRVLIGIEGVGNDFDADVD